MAEKNYTEYERDLRDFEKKPLAKDRETLIFPPESNIKGSDKQDPSVLPAAPKLSMRKISLTTNDPKVQQAIQAVKEAAQLAKVEGEIEIKTEEEDGYITITALCESAEDIETWSQMLERQKKYPFDDGGFDYAQHVKGELFIVLTEKGGTFGNSTLKKKLSMRKKAEFQVGDNVKLHEDIDPRVIPQGAEFKIVRVLNEEEKISTGKDYIVEGPRGHRFVVSADDIDSSPKSISEEASKKKASKKISVNDKILTSSKKKAKVVKVSDDLIFWVSMEGDDFGSDFVDEVELFEEHEPFEEHGLGRGRNLREDGDGLGRGRRGPVDEGITKEIPMEEKVDLASKNRRKKKAGTWALPFTPAAATTLESIVNRLKDSDISIHEAKEELTNVFGDDSLFDELDDLQNSIAQAASESIRSSVGVLLDDYDTEDFTEELDPEARIILNRIVAGV